MSSSKEDNNKEAHKACKEYNSLKYKTMMMTGTNMDTKIENEASEEKINSFLMKEMDSRKKQPWNKLTKTDKIKKIKHYIETQLKEEHHLTQSECKLAQKYMTNLIERKKLTKNSELDYDEESGFIGNIHIILFNNTMRKFTLNKDFRTSAKKKPNPRKTIKKVKTEEAKTDELKTDEVKPDEVEIKIENEVKV